MKNSKPVGLFVSMVFGAALCGAGVVHAATLSISCGAVGQEFEFCKTGTEAWAKKTGNEVKLISGAMVTLALSTSALVILPYLQVHDAPPLPGLKPYTSAELRGRERLEADTLAILASLEPADRAVFAQMLNRGRGGGGGRDDRKRDAPNR